MTTRRDLVMQVAATAAGGAGGPQEGEVSTLVRLATEANAAFMRGEMTRWASLVTCSEDFTLMSPFGGAPSRGFDPSPERLAAMSRYFSSASATDFELVQSYASRDMVVLAAIERARAVVGGLPEQDWALRVTLVYRREESGWQLVHRHADPLVHGIRLESLAALARGAER